MRPEDGVELSFTDQESVVLRPDRALGVGKVERDTVVQRNDVEVAEAGRHWPAQHLGKELGRGAGEEDLFRARLDQIIDMKHELVQLAGRLDWDWLDGEIAPL